MGTNYIEMLSEKITHYPVYLDTDTLDMYCEYLLSSDGNKCISFSNLLNLRDYIAVMDPKVFMQNDSKYARYQFVQNFLEAKIDQGITSKALILEYINSQVDPKFQRLIKTHILDSFEEGCLQKKDIEYINSSVYHQLNMVFMHNYKRPLTKMIEDVETNTFGSKPEYMDNAIQFFQKLLSELTKVQRRAKQENRFNLSDPALFKAMLQEGCERLLSDSQFLECGMQGLNKMLNGGFENARVYNFIGATGGFKSGLMLNLMKQFQLCNKGKEHKDPTKRPTILFLSQENNIWETLLRIFGIYASTQPIKQFTPEQIVNMLASGGFTLVQDDDDIDIEFRYYGNMDIGVQDVKGIVEEMDNGGREVICIIQDYIERLRPPQRNVEKRIQLFDVSNELHDLAIELDIPIITGSQFNSQGVATIEQMQQSNKFDIGRNVKSSDISESFGMLKNFDVNIGIVIEYDSADERYYLSFRKLKMRGADDMAIDYFLQPFIGRKSKIQLMVDYGEETPVYRLSLGDELKAEMYEEADNLEIQTRRKKALYNSELELDTEVDDDNQRFFDSMFADNQRSTAKLQRAGLDDTVDYNEDGMIILTCLPTAYMFKDKLKKMRGDH
nr:MAG TPA: DNA polymerase B Like Replicative Helicase [Caudoviricetes sp.]